MKSHGELFVKDTPNLQSSAELRNFRVSLLSWYRENRRSLPWRRTHDPYRIWVSEIMLQQTRVAAVLEHYKRFLQRFPNVRDLAAASESEVLAEWSGLGYYRRARMLHRAAKIVLTEHGARLPRRSDDLRELPGIGRYTANAIASIAFHEPVAVVDGNVERVVSRLLKRQLAGEILWQTAQRLLDPESPGDFNQAMMELGATVCLPGLPQCGVCPVNRMCASRGANRQSRSMAEQRLRKSASLFLVKRRNAILLRQRSESNRLMAGMWELPERETAPNRKPLLKVKHSITTTDWSVSVFAHPQMKVEEHSRWVPLSEVSRLPLTGLTRKILRRLRLIA